MMSFAETVLQNYKVKCAKAMVRSVFSPKSSFLFPKHHHEFSFSPKTQTWRNVIPFL